MATDDDLGLGIEDLLDDIEEQEPTPSEMLQRLRTSVLSVGSNEEARRMISQISGLTRDYRIKRGIGLPTSPADQGVELDSGFVVRPHIRFLSDKLADAVRDVERGQNRMLATALPPRTGKSTLISFHFVLWLLRRHPEWKIMMASHDGGLAGLWARSVRRTIEEYPNLGVLIARDGGATTEWSTVEGGGVLARGIRSSLTGRGARVIIIDDPIKDFVEAHSVVLRQMVWNWWLSVAQTRLEPPYLVLVVMTRWHQDDLMGRLFSDEHEGNPKDWAQLSLSAIAEQHDPLGRKQGEPLFSPIITETEEEAIDRWKETSRNVGSYVFSAMYQQRPAPERGAIFDAGWWRFWTWDPAKAMEGKVVFLDPATLSAGHWIDSWDMSFKGVGDADFVVGQRWVRHLANRYLIYSNRGRWSFTQTLAELRVWDLPNDPVHSPYGHLVHEHLVEDTANGPAIIDTLKKEIAGLIPIGKKYSKEAYARAITPECESGNVYLPHPSDPGNEWVKDLLSELNDFPHGTDDDQVDAFSQALARLRTPGRGRVSVPGEMAEGKPDLYRRDLAGAARTDSERRRVPGRMPVQGLRVPRAPGR